MNLKQYDFSTIFKDSKVPTACSRKKAASLQAYYDTIPDRASFYVLYDVRSPFRIKWTKNLDQILGYNKLNFQEMIRCIHPEWQFIVLEIYAAVYRTFAQKSIDFDLDRCYYHLNIPLRHAKGHYVWLNHYSVPGELDEAGRMVTHFSAYRYLEDYSNYLRIRPIIFEENRRGYGLENMIIRAVENKVYQQCFSGLRQAELGLLRDFRKIIANSQRCDSKQLPTNQQVADYTGKPLATIKTYNHRILESTRRTFPLKNYSSVAELAFILERLFSLNTLKKPMVL